jgi:hypothetical protein
VVTPEGPPRHRVAPGQPEKERQLKTSRCRPRAIEDDEAQDKDGRGAWQVELNQDVTITTDGTMCHIGGVVSVTFALEEVDFVWSEIPSPMIEPVGFLNLRMKDRPGTLATIRMNRQEALQVRTLLEGGTSLPVQ